MSIVHHGALDYGELASLGVTPEQVVDFSSNCNPFGPPPAVVKAIRTLSPAALARYPDRHCLALREQLTILHDVEPSWIAVGNGSAELIWGVARAFLRSGDIAVVMGPTFGEYAAASAAAGAQVVEVSPQGSPFDKLRVPSELSDAKLVWLCNPNNPTGYLWTPEALQKVREDFPNAIIVIDEAYLPFVPQAMPSQPDERTIILRSLTKDFGMAGIRLGYLLATPEMVAQIRALLPPWSVSATAQAAGLAALDSLAWREETLAIVREAGRVLRSSLEAQGWQIHEGSVPFFLLNGHNGAHLRAKLLQKGLVVRDCASFGLPEWVRIAPQRAEENKKLVSALKAIGKLTATASPHPPTPLSRWERGL